MFENQKKIEANDGASLIMHCRKLIVAFENQFHQHAGRPE
jgi:hypothetical protein